MFHNWRIGEEREFSSDPKTRYHFGADWGFANDPTVLIRCLHQGPDAVCRPRSLCHRLRD